MIYKVSAMYCQDCKVHIYSRAHHDFNSCDCGGAFMDGGTFIENSENNPDYMRTNVGETTSIEIDFDGTEKEFRKALHEDWSYGKDKYGKKK